MKRDVIDRLADARPDALDPTPDPVRRAHDLNRATSTARERRGFSFTRPRVAVVALVAGAVAAAGIIVTSPDDAGTPAPGQSTKPPAMDARSVLLAAAQQAEKAPTGRYWRVETVDGNAYRVQDAPAGGGYTVLGYSLHSDQWQAPSPSLPDITYWRDLGAKPLTAEDEAAWRRAGSPKTFKVVSSGDRRVLSTRPGGTEGTGSGGWTADVFTASDKKKINRRRLCEKAGESVTASGAPCSSRVSDAELEALADEPARLREALFPEGGIRDARKKSGLDNPALRLGDFYRVLVRRALSPKTRAAVFRLAAEETGIRSVGTVRDPRGRSGIGLSARSSTRALTGTVFDYRLILDPKTHRILAGIEVVVRASGSDKGLKPGDLLSQQIVLANGWTDDKPRHP